MCIPPLDLTLPDNSVPTTTLELVWRSGGIITETDYEAPMSRIGIISRYMG